MWFEDSNENMKLFLTFWRKYWEMAGHPPPPDMMDPVEQFLFNDLLFFKKWKSGAIPIDFETHFNSARTERSKTLRGFASGKVVQEPKDSTYKFEFTSRVIAYWNTSHLVKIRQERNFFKFKRLLRDLIMRRKITYLHKPGSNKAVASN